MKCKEIQRCVAVGVGMYSDDGRTAKACNQGQYANKETSEGVPAEGSDRCVTCPPRWVCSSGVNRGRCSPGLYPGGGDTLGAGALRCDPCPAGTRCPLHTDLPESCGDGQYSGVGQVSCSECVSGQFLEFVTSNASGTWQSGPLELAHHPPRNVSRVTRHLSASKSIMMKRALGARDQ